MNKEFYKYVFFALLSIAISGCKSYEKSEDINWTELSEVKNPSVVLNSPDDAAKLALVGNLELNELRLKAASAANIAKETGWWEDPELDFDILRIIESANHPFLGGANLKFTIPLSGVNKASKKAAEAYHDVELQKIKVQELDVAIEAKKTIIAIYYNQMKIKALESYEKDAGIIRATKSAERLYKAGEYTLINLNSVKRQEHAREHERMELEDEKTELENKFRALAGLHPKTHITLSFSLPHNKDIKLKKIDILSLTSHPAVKTALAKLEHTELELKTEILKQYPELKIGPLAGNEEGKDRIGVVAGITLPLWNRNRKGIAEAEANRNEARLSAINTWKSLALESNAAFLKAEKLLNHPPAPVGESKYADRLLEAGEMTPIDYLSTRDEILKQSLDEISWRASIASSITELSKYTTETL